MAVAHYVKAVRRALIVPALLFLASAAWAYDARDTATPAARLPAEARDMLKRIERGGPYRYDRDGAVFGNHERLLPPRSRGYYREYTVDTPGLKHRGARRLVVGCDRDRVSRAATDPGAFAGFRECAGPASVYYTEDHYRSFRRVTP